jgi:hypothetical protein
MIILEKKNIFQSKFQGKVAMYCIDGLARPLRLLYTARSKKHEIGTGLIKSIFLQDLEEML